MKNELTVFTIGIIIGWFIFLLIFTFFEKDSRPYRNGVKDTHQEAFEMGLMEKEIGKDDKVIYKWIETHRLGYE
jgi:hypothetical protein